MQFQPGKPLVRHIALLASFAVYDFVSAKISLSCLVFYSIMPYQLPQHLLDSLQRDPYSLLAGGIGYLIKSMLLGRKMLPGVAAA